MKTSYYASRAIDPTRHIPVGISLGGVRWKIPYEVVARVRELMPEQFMLRELRNDPPAFAAAYRAKLDGIGVNGIRRRLATIQATAPEKELVLLCFEHLDQPGQWCHRRLLAAWWEEQTGEAIPELDSATPAPQQRSLPWGKGGWAN